MADDKTPCRTGSIEKDDISFQAEDGDCPDGGLSAWGAVLGAFLALSSTWGIIMSFGSFKRHYSEKLLTESSTAVISVVGSLQLFLAYGLGPLVGRVFDAYGARVLVPAGCALTVLSLFLTSFCQNNKPYQVFLSHGILLGVGTSFLSTPSYAIVNQWFYHRRAMALSIVQCGCAMGGTVFPLIIPHLIHMVGFSWAVRICGLIVTVCLAITWATLRPRLTPPGGMSWKSAVDLGGFQDARYVLASASSCLTAYAIYIPYFFINDYAKINNVPEHLAELLVTITSACGIVSRILPAFIGNRIKPLDILTFTTWASATLVLGFWLPSHGATPIAIFGGLYGFFSGPATSMVPAYIACISPQAHYGARLGTIDLFIAVATLVGPPTQGALLDPMDAEHFRNLIVFTGVMLVASGVVLLATRFADSNHKRSV